MSRKSDLANRIGAIMDAVESTDLLTLPRMIEEVDGITGPGAEQVAKLTLAARSQDWVFSHVVNALQALETLPSEAWKRPFMVAVAPRESFGEPTFFWNTAPVRRYASFLDFYRRELEQTFGRWIDLQALWQRRVAGEVTEDEAKKEIEARAARAQAADAKDRALQEQQPHGGDRRSANEGIKFDNKNSDSKLEAPPTGTTAAYAHRRLRKDRPDLHARVLAGEISPHAAMVQAGFRKRAKSRARTPLDRLRTAWRKATPAEREAFLNEVQVIQR
jgi:hypothetical protein